MVFNAYGVTIFVTIVGTLAAILMTFGAAYALANRQCRYRDGLALYFYITMVFSAGLVPWYLINRNLGIYNNIWALIIPSLMFSPFNMFLMRNFIRGIPEELNDSARIDGAGEIRTAFSIYLPLCLPTIATISLFYAIGYWNNFFNALMLVHERTLFPLQLILFRIASEMSQMNMTPDGVARAMPPREGFTMATALITMGPIILLYPFLQRYFVKGIVLGAVKG
jgi:putative aldouronate transport system permease protein